MIPVEGHSNLYRDEITNAIINCNDYEYKQYLKIKDLKLKEKNELNCLKKEVEELKDLIKQLIDCKS
ncbi:MAG: Prochlorococcus phage [Bacteroidota bacterium]|jgi:hypothetical protein